MLASTILPAALAVRGTCSRWLQEIKTLLPGPEWVSSSSKHEDEVPVTNLPERTVGVRDHHEKTNIMHDWYTAYSNARKNGNSEDEAAVMASGHVERSFYR